MSIHDAHRALVEARTAVEHELADVTARLARIDAAITALEPDVEVPTPVVTAPVKSARKPPAPKRQSSAPKREPSTPKHQPAAIDYQEIADWINQARRDGTYTQKSLAAAFDVPESTSRNYLTKCRRLGLLDSVPPGAGTPNLAPARPSSTPAAGPKTFRCAECEFGAASAKDMAHHTITRHKRGPLPDERTAA